MLNHIIPKRLKRSRPHLNFKGKWQSGDHVSIWYLIYQLVMCLFLLSNVIWTWIKQTERPPDERWKYLIYLTNWGICTLNVCVLLETCLTIYIYLHLSSGDKKDKLSGGMDRLLHFSWGFTYSTFSVAVVITLLYWTLLGQDDEVTYHNLYVHAFQSVYTVVDQCVTDRPWEPGHWWIAPLLPLAYIIFNVIYWAAGGTNEHGEDFVYPVLDWSKDPGQATGLVFGAFLLIIGIHYLMALLTLVRNKLHAKWFKPTPIKPT